MVSCTGCKSEYRNSQGTLEMLRRDAPVRAWYTTDESASTNTTSSIKTILEQGLRLIRTPARVWTRESEAVIHDMLQEKNPDHADRRVVLIGSGFEPVFKKATRGFRELIRVGLAHRGKVDIAADIGELPMQDKTLDLIFSSSVLEHVYDPEKAVSEMSRVVKPGGYAYAEIPFMRAFHMMPVDYQRYTISGIEELFKRHGFELIQKGVCSGPFTASVLFFLDFWRGALSFNKYLMKGFRLVFSLLLHPVKYLDRLVEGRKWTVVNACNFYYLGKIPE